MGFIENLYKFKGNFIKDVFSVGMDIGEDSVKLVKLKVTKDAAQLCGFDLAPVGSDLAGALKKLKESKASQRVVNISVAGHSTVIRYVEFPRMSREELNKALRFEAQKHIPFAISEVVLDGYILKRDAANNNMLVLIAAVKKVSLSQRLKIIEDAGFLPAIVDLDSVAVINAFCFNYAQDESLKGKSVALLNIGASVSNLNILEDYSARLSRDIYSDSKALTQKLEAALTSLSAEIRTSFDYYESQSVSSVTKIFLSGGASKTEGLKEMLENLLSIEVQYWDPLARVSLSSEVDAGKAKELSGQFAVALGLALRC